MSTTRQNEAERRFPRRFLIAVPATAAAATVAGTASADAAPPRTAWALGGNANVSTDGSNWLGTRNAAPLIVKTRPPPAAPGRADARAGQRSGRHRHQRPRHLARRQGRGGQRGGRAGHHDLDGGHQRRRLPRHRRPERRLRRLVQRPRRRRLGPGPREQHPGRVRQRHVRRARRRRPGGRPGHGQRRGRDRPASRREQRRGLGDRCLQQRFTAASRSRRREWASTRWPRPACTRSGSARTGGRLRGATRARPTSTATCASPAPSPRIVGARASTTPPTRIADGSPTQGGRHPRQGTSTTATRPRMPTDARACACPRTWRRWGATSATSSPSSATSPMRWCPASCGTAASRSHSDRPRVRVSWQVTALRDDGTHGTTRAERDRQDRRRARHPAVRPTRLRCPSGAGTPTPRPELTPMSSRLRRSARCSRGPAARGRCRRRQRGHGVGRAARHRLGARWQRERLHQRQQLAGSQECGSAGDQDHRRCRRDADRADARAAERARRHRHHRTDQRPRRARTGPGPGRGPGGQQLALRLRGAGQRRRGHGRSVPRLLRRLRRRPRHELGRPLRLGRHRGRGRRQHGRRARLEHDRRPRDGDDPGCRGPGSASASSGRARDARESAFTDPGREPRAPACGPRAAPAGSRPPGSSASTGPAPISA